MFELRELDSGPHSAVERQSSPARHQADAGRLGSWVDRIQDRKLVGLLIRGLCRTAPRLRAVKPNLGSK
jgi:hypothetical protein